MKKKLVIICSLFIATTSFAQKNKTIEIPFTMDRNLILIKAKLTNNGTQTFIFDTGTESIMLWNELASKYKVVGLDSMTTPDGVFVETQEKVNIPKISFDGLSLSNKVATKMPRQMIFSNKAVGIIGMQTFVGYMITLDYTNSKIILKKGSLLNEINTIHINLDHILEAKVMLNNKEVLAHFDCGGAGYISVPKAWDNIYKIKAAPILSNKGRTPMGDFDVYKADLDGDIEIGNYTLTNPKISLVTGDFFYAVNFGYEFFKEHSITIDTKNKLLQINKK
jgi:Aspartyl protease